MPIPEIIDVHTHCFTGRAGLPALVPVVGELKKRGFTRVVTLGLINTAFDRETAACIMPPFVDNRGAQTFDEADDLLGLADDLRPFLIPFADMRHLAGDPAPELSFRIGQGFMGIKGIYLPDENNDLGVRPIPDALGMTRAAYERRESEVFRFAEERGLPLLYHMDARRYGDRMESLLKDFPRARVNIPHLGVSRKAFAPFLERHENLFTDFAFLKTHVEKDPAGYRDFMVAFADRICFGTDALLHGLLECADYADMMDGLRLGPEITEKICSANPRRFLGPAAYENRGKAATQPSSIV